MIYNIVVFLVFLLFSAFFSASETAIFSLSKSQLRHLKNISPQGKNLEHLLKKPTLTLSAIVFGNMLVNIGFSSLAAILFIELFPQWGWLVAVLVSTFFILFLGEIFPKVLAIHFAQPLSLYVCLPLLYIRSFLYPLIRLLDKIVTYISALFLRQVKEQVLGEEEIKTALAIGTKGGGISEEEAKLANYLLEFKDTEVSAILTPRLHIQAVDKNWSRQRIESFLRRVKHSKLPVYEESLDNIVGILYTKTFFLYPDKDWHLLLRKPLFIPQTQHINTLLKMFLEKNERIVIVVDAYGGTSGLVTLEDIKEEIFGELYDEFEVPRQDIEKIDEETYLINPATAIKTVNIQLNLSLPEEEDTLAGFILAQAGKIPSTGEKIKFSNLIFTIEKATSRKISLVRLEFT